jgi:polyisoprenyl-phosphate glycosyltransferase
MQNCEHRTDFTLLIPTRNEAGNILKLYQATKPSMDYIESMGYKVKWLFVDNASRDETLNEISLIKREDPRIFAASWVRNYGIGASVYNGFLYANSRATLVFDCDLQDPPNLIVSLFNLWKSGMLFSYGVRQNRVEPKYLTLSRSLFRIVAKILGGNGNSEVESGLWLLDETVIEDLRLNPPNSPYLAGALANREYLSGKVPYNRGVRDIGDSKFNFRRYLSYALDGIIGDNKLVLRFTFIVAFLASLLSFVLLGLLLLAKIFNTHGVGSGIASNSIILNLYGVSILFSLGIQNEYIRRIFFNSSRMPVAVTRLSF